MPRGTPLTSPASLVWFSRRSGLTKLSTTRLTEGCPSPRSTIQWLFVSKSVMSRTVAQVHASLPQCQAPYTWIGGLPAAGVTGTRAAPAGVRAAPAGGAASRAASATQRAERIADRVRIGALRRKVKLVYSDGPLYASAWRSGSLDVTGYRFLTRMFA